METSVDIGLSSEELRIILSEVKSSHQDLEFEEEEPPVLDEVEQATDFLNKVGLSNLSKIYLDGKEITDLILKDSVSQRNLTEKQAYTVKSRIKTLNRTLRNRQPRRKQRQDIRDIAWNAETSSTGTRSRSATPDSLDSVEANREELTSDEDQQLPTQPYSLDTTNMVFKGKLKWTSSEPLHNKFSKLDRGDIAHLGSSKVILKGYQPLNEFGTLTRRERSGSDPTADTVNEQNGDAHHPFVAEEPVRSKLSRSHTSLINDNDQFIDNGAISFEGFIKQNEDISTNVLDSLYSGDAVPIDELTDSQYQHLKPLLWMEVTAIFDQHKITILKRKASSKNKRGNVFGVSLATLVMRDMPIPTDNSMLPEIFKIIIEQLESRCLNEDGILRVGGQQQKLNHLCNEIESKFYNNRKYVENLLNQASPHDLTGVLKKLLRDLPDTIFTMELLDMFYKCGNIPSREDQIKALNLLILLLPVEHRNTFHLVLQFCINVTEHKEQNRMNLHNVAMIVAPSCFSPRLLIPKETLKTNGKPPKVQPKEELIKHINGAALCCSTMEQILKNGHNLWMVPGDLAQQAKDAQKQAQSRKDIAKEKRFKYGKSKLHRSSTQYEVGNMISPRIKKSDLLV